jgi:hypothetical protein
MTLVATPNDQQFVSNGSLQGKVFQLLPVLLHMDGLYFSTVNYISGRLIKVLL